MEIYTQLKTKLKDSGAVSRIVSASHIPELESEYYLSLTNWQIDKQFVKKSILNYINFSVTKNYPTAQSLIIIATPSPEIELIFNHDDEIYLVGICVTHTVLC